jgi:hypothetical protein
MCCVVQVKAEFVCFLTWLIAFSIFMLLFQVGSSAVLVTLRPPCAPTVACAATPYSPCNLHFARHQSAVWRWCLSFF